MTTLRYGDPACYARALLWLIAIHAYRAQFESSRSHNSPTDMKCKAYVVDTAALTPYEVEREELKARNRQRLLELDLPALAKAAVPDRPKLKATRKQKVSSGLPARRSERLAEAPKPSYKDSCPSPPPARKFPAMETTTNNPAEATTPEEVAPLSPGKSWVKYFGEHRATKPLSDLVHEDAANTLKDGSFYPEDVADLDLEAVQGIVDEVRKAIPVLGLGAERPLKKKKKNPDCRAVTRALTAEFPTLVNDTTEKWEVYKKNNPKVKSGNSRPLSYAGYMLNACHACCPLDDKGAWGNVRLVKQQVQADSALSHEMYAGNQSDCCWHPRLNSPGKDELL